MRRPINTKPIPAKTIIILENIKEFITFKKDLAYYNATLAVVAVIIIGTGMAVLLATAIEAAVSTTTI